MIMSSVLAVSFFLPCGWECDFSPLTLLTGEPNITITANIRYRGVVTLGEKSYWRIAWCGRDNKCREILIARHKE